MEAEVPKAGHMMDLGLAGCLLRLKVSASAFVPSLTTRVLADRLAVTEGCSLLDMGCGVGPLAIVAAKEGACPVYAVDVMEEACVCARENAEINGVADRIHVLKGDLFEPVRGMTFDVIVDDASGMADEVARLSPWYPKPIPTGGHDGTEVTMRVLRDASAHLNRGGRLYFPVLSLSRAHKIVNEAYALYGSAVKLLEERMIPFCRELRDHMDELKALRERGLIDYTSRRSRALWNLKVFMIRVA